MKRHPHIDPTAAELLSLAVMLLSAAGVEPPDDTLAVPQERWPGARLDFRRKWRA